MCVMDISEYICVTVIETMYPVIYFRKATEMSE